MNHRGSSNFKTKMINPWHIVKIHFCWSSNRSNLRRRHHLKIMRTLKSTNIWTNKSSGHLRISMLTIMLPKWNGLHPCCSSCSPRTSKSQWPRHLSVRTYKWSQSKSTNHKLNTTGRQMTQVRCQGAAIHRKYKEIERQNPEVKGQQPNKWAMLCQSIAVQFRIRRALQIYLWLVSLSIPLIFQVASILQDRVSLRKGNRWIDPSKMQESVRYLTTVYQSHSQA